METRDVLADAFGRVMEITTRVADGATAEELAHRPGPEANSIAWLLWHLTRVQDHHVSDLAGRDQVWVEEGWAARFGLPDDPDDTGYGHTPEQVASIRPDGPEPLVEYHQAVYRRTLEYLETVDAGELRRVVDRRWDPPVTAGVRLVSVISDDLQHAGQAAYVKGLIEAGEG